MAYDPSTYRAKTKNGITTNVLTEDAPHRPMVLCYIAGVECPIISAAVSYGVWKIPEASVAVFPDPEFQRLGAQDRVPIVLFYLDEHYHEAPTWCLLFEGEITGWTYTNTPLGRTINFQCVADIAVWTQLFLFYMTNLSGVVQGTTNRTTEQLSQAVAVYPYALFKRGLIVEGDNTDIKRPFDFAYNIVRNLIGQNVPLSLRSVPAVNFFSRWVRRNQFHNKWVALPYLDEVHDATGKPLTNQPPGMFPVLRAVQSEQAVRAVQSVVESTSGASIWHILKRVLDTVLMELVMLPTAPAVRTYLDGNIIGKPKVIVSPTNKAFIPNCIVQDGDEDKIVDPKEPLRIANYFVKPQMYFGLPPACNVIFPSVMTQFSYQENFITQPTRLYFEDDALLSLIPSQTRDSLDQVVLNRLARAYPPEADVRFQKSKKQLATMNKNILLYPEEFFKGPVTARNSAPPWLMFYTHQLSADGVPSKAPLSTPTNKTVKPVEGDSITDQDLYALYAQYSFFRETYSQRNGAVEMAFHPYLIPGLPSFIFDSFQTRLHVVGYLMNVTHQFSGMSAVTSANYTYGRTLYEFFNDVREEIENPIIAERSNTIINSAPPEPIPEIRDVIQHFDVAEKFYQTLLYQRQEAPIKPAVAVYTDLLSYIGDNGEVEDIKIDGDTYEARVLKEAQYADAYTTLNKYATDKEFAATISSLGEQIHGGKVDTTVLRDALALGGVELPDIQKVDLTNVNKALFGIEVAQHNLSKKANAFTNLSSSKEVIPKPGYEAYFDSYDAAMKYCSRPVCTLEEYIYFIGGVREGINDEFSYGDVTEEKRRTVSARYYTRIRHLTGADENTKVSSAIKGTAGTKPEAVSADFPQMRAKWDEIILKYRRKFYKGTKVGR